MKDMDQAEWRAFLKSAPQEVRDIVAKWGRLEAMSKDTSTYPTLAAEMREANAYNERDMWRAAVDRLQTPQLKAVEPEEANEG